MENCGMRRCTFCLLEGDNKAVVGDMSLEMLEVGQKKRKLKLFAI